LQIAHFLFGTKINDTSNMTAIIQGAVLLKFCAWWFYLEIRSDRVLMIRNDKNDHPVCYKIHMNTYLCVIYVHRHDDYYYYYLLCRLSSFALVSLSLSLFLSPPVEDQILLKRTQKSYGIWCDGDDSLRVCMTNYHHQNTSFVKRTHIITLMT